MKLLIIGKEGQLARALAERASDIRELERVFAGRPEVDLQVPGAVADAIRSVRPDLVVNAAAYTAVDQAEDEPQLAMRINGDAAGEAAAAAHAVGAPIVQISTDYVFDGTAGGAYREDAETNPLGSYGRSKLEGEEQVRASNPMHLIIRTAWVYSPWGRNFVRTMLNLARERDEVRVVADQFGSPTSALDLADALLSVAPHMRDEGRSSVWGTYHLVARGRCSWADFAERIFTVSASLGGPSAAVRRIATEDFPTRASRPRNSALDSGKFERRFGYAMPMWADPVATVVERLVAQQPGAKRV